MTNFVFNIAKGRAGYYATLPGATDSLIIVALELAGLENDTVLQDYDNLSVLLAGTSNEQVSVGRLPLNSVSSNIDDTNNWAMADCADNSFVGAGGNAIGALLICYKPDSSAADTAIIPLTKHDFVSTPNGGDISILVASTGFYRAT